jgi:hypothetical protein
MKPAFFLKELLRQKKCPLAADISILCREVLTSIVDFLFCTNPRCLLHQLGHLL